MVRHLSDLTGTHIGGGLMTDVTMKLTKEPSVNKKKSTRQEVYED